MSRYNTLTNVLLGRCRDCGSPTRNYRCAKCTRKHLEKHSSVYYPEDTYKVFDKGKYLNMLE